MSEPVRELQQNLFGGLHDFHVERTATLIDAVRQELGDEILDVIQETGIDRYGLYRWHMERMLSWIDGLIKKYGPNALDIMIDKQRKVRHEQGSQIAGESGKNGLEDIIPFFTYGNPENILTKDDRQATIKATGCLAAKIAVDIDRRDMVYRLYCNIDQDFVAGFNRDLGCEIVQTLMDGCDCCIHRIYVKE